MSDPTTLYTGDWIAVLQTLADCSLQCCVTSPPYWGLRDYGVEGQLGLEKTPEEYVAKIVAGFRDVRRVLRKDGTLWLNLGDSYASNPSSGGASTAKLHGPQNATPDRGWKQPPGLKPKDLVGIPWLVAFALRAPWEVCAIKEKIDRAWLAALTDGEGCITILNTRNAKGAGNSYPPVLQVRMCDVQPILKCQEITGFGETTPVQHPPSQGGQRGSYQWRIHGQRCSDVIAAIYPYLLIKRQQAIVAFNHQLVRDSYEVKRGSPIPDEALQKQLLCRELIQKLNKRESIVLPSWMVEPSFRTEPGWYLRQDCIWSKPNPMPESVRDRCTKSHEYVFLLSKSEKYYYDQEAIAEPVALSSIVCLAQPGLAEQSGSPEPGKTNGNMKAASSMYGGPNSGFRKKHCPNNSQPSDKPTEGIHDSKQKRNRRSVWEVATTPYPEAHFATYPEALITPMILAGCPEGGTVLDPFAGSGTTLAVAKKLGRLGVGIELNPEYVKLAEKRISAVTGNLFAP